jgi:hypothetical protein
VQRWFLNAHPTITNDAEPTGYVITDADANGVRESATVCGRHGVRDAVERGVT